MNRNTQHNINCILCSLHDIAQEKMVGGWLVVQLNISQAAAASSLWSPIWGEHWQDWQLESASDEAC